MGGNKTSREEGVPKGLRRRIRGLGTESAMRGAGDECPDQLSLILETFADAPIATGMAGLAQSTINPSALAIIQGNTEIAIASDGEAGRILECLRRGERYEAEIIRKEEAGLTVRLIVVIRRL